MTLPRQVGGRIGVLVLMGLGLILVGLAASLPSAPRLVWNASASAPIGLYWLSPSAPVERGNLVLAALPEPSRRLAAARGYIPDGVPVLKRIAATAGAVICTDGDILTVAGRPASRLVVDSAGRALPHWHGCRVLASDEIFLLMADVPDSFDSRYFGPVSTAQIVGKVTPLWTD